MGAKIPKEQKGVPEQVSKKGANLSDIPARVDKVNITGLRRTKNDYLHQVPDELFKVTNFQDVILECNNAKNYLTELGVFKDVVIKIDVSKGQNASPNGYEVNFEGVELSQISGEIGTEVGYNEGGLKISLEAPNFAGRGERITLRGSRTTSSTVDMTLNFMKPFHHTELRHYHPELSLSLFKKHSSFPYMACKTRNFGLLSELNFSTPFNLSHSLQYEVSYRELFSIKKHVPFSVRKSCGPRMMSAFRLSTTYDLRDNPIFPTQGVYIKMTNELSGLGGDISYISNTTHAELNIPLHFNWVAQICSKIGIMHGIRSSKGLPKSSLFSLGGPMNLRGFELAGVGPQDEGYAAGMTSFWAVGLHLWMPMPFYSQLGPLSQNWRTHLFCNFGNCNSFLINDMRIAFGIGLAYRIFKQARVEVNWCFPINTQTNDKITSGFQFGIGYDFL